MVPVGHDEKRNSVCAVVSVGTISCMQALLLALSDAITLKAIWINKMDILVGIWVNPEDDANEFSKKKSAQTLSYNPQHQYVR